MKDAFLTKRTASQVVAVLIFAAGQQFAHCEENRLDLHTPNTYAAEADATPADDIRPIDGEQSQSAAQQVDEVEIVRERYPDGKVKLERQVTLDAAGNYVNHGIWRMYSPTETIIAEGQYDMGKRVGSWARWLNREDSPAFAQPAFKGFKPPFASQAIFSNGVMDGEWIVTDVEGHKVLQVSLSGGKRHGMFVTYLPNGKPSRQASYDNGVPVGDVLEADAKTGELKRVATYIEGRRISTKTAQYPLRNRNRTSRNRKEEPQKKSEEMYLAATTVEKAPDNFWTVALAEYEQQGKDLRHGPSKAWFENGQVQAEGFYQFDKRAGQFTYWYANGQMAATGEYADDQPDNSWTWWHENGLKAALGTYRDGKLCDEWRFWGTDGKLVECKTYDGTEAIAKTPPQDVIKLGRRPNEKSTQGAKPLRGSEKTMRR